MNKKVILAMVFVVLVIIAAYYVINQSQRESNLIGDKICGNLESQDARDACCLNIHKDDTIIVCSSTVEYVYFNNTCKFECANVLPSGCTAEFKTCPDGTTSVGRNSSRNCEFDACPVVKMQNWPETQAQCEQRGGNWTQFYTLVGLGGQACVLSTSDVGKKCNDYSECQGACLDSQGAQDGQQTSGICSATTYENYEGCGVVVVRGVARTVICE